jgi:hypothetical protein
VTTVAVATTSTGTAIGLDEVAFGRICVGDLRRAAAPGVAVHDWRELDRFGCSGLHTSPA